MSVDDLISPNGVPAVLRAAGLRPRKQLGQNFLVERSILETMIAEVRRLRPRCVLEIGAGLGVLTRELAQVVDSVVALEVDPRLVSILKQTVVGLENVEIRCQDILSFDIEKAFGGEAAFVVGNLPYRITTPILKQLIAQRRAISHALLMTQKEVAEKIAASPGPRGTAFGVFVRAYADQSVIREVPRGCFWPVPKVDSTLWLFSSLDRPRFSADPDTFFAIVRLLYGKRRKMIRGVLRDLVPSGKIEETLEAAGIAATIRGETLTFADLDRLALAVGRIRSVS